MANNENVKQAIPAMYGNFSIYGKVESINKDKFYSKTQTQRDKRSLTLGIRTSKDNVVYIPMNAVSQNNVYFVKRNPETNKTEDTKIIPWDERNSVNLPEEYTPMSRITVGLEQETDDKGVLQNKREHKILFDALQDIYDLVDVGDDLYIRGSVDVESYTAQNGEKRNIVRLTPTQISKRRTNKELDFEAEDFTETNELNQTLIPTSVEVDDDMNRAVIYGLVIGNKKEGSIEIEVTDEENLKFVTGRLKELIEENPYMAIRIQAKIVNQGRAPEKVWDDFLQTYVKRESSNRNSMITKYEFVSIIENSYDLTTYNQENIEEFRNAFCRGQEEFGANSANKVAGSEDSIWGSI